MKQHRLYFGTIVTAAVFLAGLSACSIDETGPQDGLRRISIKATIENDTPGTKVIIDDGNHGEEGVFHWSDDDALALYVVENGVGAYRITENYGATGGKDNKFDIYISDAATRSGFAFYPPYLVLANGNYHSYPLPDISTSKPQIFLPPSYLPYGSLDGRFRGWDSPLPMIAANKEGSDNLIFKHLGGMIRIVVDRKILAFRWRVAVGDMVDGVFHAYKINGIFDVVSSNPEAETITEGDILAGKCFIKVNEADTKTGNDIWAFDGNYNVVYYPAVNRTVYSTDTLNIPVPTGHYTTVVVRAFGRTNQDILAEGTYSLGPDGWTCQRRHAWKLGITLDPYGTEYFLSEPEALELPYDGGTASLRADQLFKSYKNVPEQGSAPAATRPVPYHLEYSEDGTNWSTTAPDWLTANSPSSFAGSVGGEDLTLTMEAQDNSAADEHHDNLVQAGIQGSQTNPFDLSTVNVATGTTCATTTANCYVVQAPGYYKFPLVYGNGVVNGTVNEDAFRGRAGVGGAYRPDAGDEAWAPASTTAEGWYMGRFKDHLDQYITSPYIATQHAGKTLTAAIIWTDAKNLVTNAAIVGSGNSAYLKFEVPEDHICQGNALVAVLAGGKIAWSWHIWVTDENLTVLKEGSNGYKFTNVNLGWCDGKTETYAERTCQVRAVQDAPGVTAENQLVTGPVTIRQTANTVTTLGNSPYYQWGRKDPLQAAAGSGNTLKTYYVHDNYTLDNNAAGKVSVGTAIQNPHKLYTDGGSGYNDWCSTSYYNNWNSALNVLNSETKPVPVTKTVYDPTPVGFKMPPMTAFDGFDSNFTWGTNNGNNGRTYNGTLFFPALGVQNHGGLAFGSQGRYFSASPIYQSFAFILYFSSSGIDTDYETQRVRGCSIRPVKDNDIIVTGENLGGWD